jgi:hypothetical protein
MNHNMFHWKIVLRLDGKHNTTKGMVFVICKPHKTQNEYFESLEVVTDKRQNRWLFVKSSPAGNSKRRSILLPATWDVPSVSTQTDSCSSYEAIFGRSNAAIILRFTTREQASFCCVSDPDVDDVDD